MTLPSKDNYSHSKSLLFFSQDVFVVLFRHAILVKPPFFQDVVLCNFKFCLSCVISWLLWMKNCVLKQGLTVNEVLDSINRELTEEELWAICREGTIALERKKKHLRKQQHCQRNPFLCNLCIRWKRSWDYNHKVKWTWHCNVFY